MFPRANISEAEDPVALRRYVVKTETRAVDLTTPTRKPCRTQSKMTNLEFFSALMDQAHLNGYSVSQIAGDTSLHIYDESISTIVASAGDPEHAMQIATRACRPDVRSIWRRYRHSFTQIWSPPGTIDVPTTIHDANDNEGRRQESGEVGSSGSEDEDEGACEDEAVSEGEGGSDSGQSADASDQESDASE